MEGAWLQRARESVRSSLAFVWYEHGGRGLHQNLLVFDLHRAGAPLLSHVSLPDATTRTLADLERRLAAGGASVEAGLPAGRQAEAAAGAPVALAGGARGGRAILASRPKRRASEDVGLLAGRPVA